MSRAVAATRADDAPVPCGQFTRLHTREALGPRNGRNTWWRLECVSCGFLTPEIRSKTAGSWTRVRPELDAALRARTCPRPPRLSAHAAWLLLVADHLAAGAPPTLRFAVEHRLAEPIPEVTARAWLACESGYVMGCLIRDAQLGKHPSTFVMPPHRSEDGTQTIVHALVGAVRVELVGADSDVAHQLRVLLPQPPPIAGWTVPVAPETRA